ncbi:MAG TPA: peptidoglycan editing factor PgeF [Candidatus Angelobacter sp.]|nr:peptidoglycan editing factor PgeF [Candidatus Angelobacter sp.]
MATITKPARTNRVRAENRLQVIQAAGLKKLPWLVHGFSTRPGGNTSCYGGRSLNLGFTKEDAKANVEKNRKQFLLALGAATDGRPWPLVANRQVHSDIIHVLRALPAAPLVGDGLITNLAGVGMAVLTADCLPVLLVDKRNAVVGAFHAGWRGTVQRIVEKGAGVMRREFGSRPEDLVAAVGPGIQKCCYVVGEELRQEFESQFSYGAELFHQVKTSDPVREKYPLLFLNQRAPGHGDPCIRIHLDLAEANRRQLLNAGVPESQITVLGECTSCTAKKFFSHRADRGRSGRMMAVVGIKP